jgi:hypothetical protein
MCNNYHNFIIQLEKSKQIPKQCDTIIFEGKIFMHSKNDEMEFWLYENKNYKIVYSDGSTAQGIWSSDNGKIIFQKDKLHSTSDKEFQFKALTREEFEKEYGNTNIPNEKNPDQYPLIAE